MRAPWRAAFATWNLRKWLHPMRNRLERLERCAELGREPSDREPAFPRVRRSLQSVPKPPGSHVRAQGRNGGWVEQHERLMKKPSKPRPLAAHGMLDSGRERAVGI